MQIEDERRRSASERLARFLLGDDIFISYSRAMAPPTRRVSRAN